MVYDVGAQYGDFSLMCSKIFSVGKVISFEPLTDIFDLFNETVKINSLDNIEVNNAAVCSADGEIRIFRNRDMAAKAGVDSHIIKSVKLDSVCNEKVDLLKIDVEGWEMDVLEGATGLISEYHPKIIIETHSLMLKNEVIAFLELFGYKVVHEGRTLYSEAADMDFVQNLYLS